MKLTDILAKVAKKETLTDAESAFLAGYDPEKATNDAVAAYRRKADEKLATAQKETDTLKTQVADIQTKLNKKDDGKKTDDQKFQDHIKNLSTQVATLTERLEASDKEKSALSRSTSIEALRQKAGIKFVSGVSEQIMAGAFASAFDGIEDLSDKTVIAPILEQFKTNNKAVIADQSGNGSGLTPHAKATRTANSPNPWKTESLNLTEQGELFKSNPAEAKRLAAAAGVKLEV